MGHLLLSLGREDKLEPGGDGEGLFPCVRGLGGFHPWGAGVGLFERERDTCLEPPYDCRGGL